MYDEWIYNIVSIENDEEDQESNDDVNCKESVVLCIIISEIIVKEKDS
jgi:hypothetical protein